MKIKDYSKGWRNGISWKCIFSILGTVLLCGFSRFQGSMIYDVNEISLYAWLHYSREELLLMGESASAYAVMADFREMEWFAVVLPLLSALPSVTDFAGQWFSGYYYSSISRKSYKKYASEWMLRAGLRGFGCIVSGILLYFVLIACKFPHYGELGLEPDSSMIAMAYGETAFLRLATLLLKVFHTGILAAILAMTSVVLTVLCKEGFFAVSSLALLGYFSKKLGSAYEGWLFMQYDNQGGADVPAFYKTLRFFFPSNHLHYDQTFSGEYGIGYGCYLIFAGFLAAAVGLWFYRMVKRRNG